MPIPVWQRFLAYLCVATVLLGIYQILFLARTSANRDWNHLHRVRVTLGDVQRAVVRLPSVDEGLQLNSSFIETQLGNYGWKTHSWKDRTYPLQVSLIVDDRPVPAAPWTDIVRSREGIVTGKTVDLGYEIRGDIRDAVVIVRVGGTTPPAEKAKQAAELGAAALILICPEEPLFGPFDSPLPTVVLKDAPSEAAIVQVSIQEADVPAEPSIEATLNGLVSGPDILLIDFRDIHTNSLLELARILGGLSQSGWRPYRSIHMVFFGHSAAADKWNPSSSLAALFTSPRLGVSPVLKPAADFAARNIPNPPNVVDWGLPSAPMGLGRLLYNHGIPLLSPPSLSGPDLVRFLGLAVSELTDHSVVPFCASCTVPPALSSPMFEEVTTAFDSRVSVLHDEYTREYPWFRWSDKLQAYVGLKASILCVSTWERSFLVNGHHALHGLDSAQVKPVLAPDMKVVQHALDQALTKLEGRISIRGAIDALVNAVTIFIAVLSSVIEQMHM